MKLKNKFNDELLEQLNMKKKGDAMNYINELKPGMEIVIDLKIISKRIQETRDGKKFLLLTLSDRTGIIRAIDWGNAEFNDQVLDIGSVARFTGKIVMYDDRLQLNIFNGEEIVLLKEGEYESSRFLAISSKNLKELYQNLLDIIGSVENDMLKKLLKSFFVDDKKFVDKFINSPAAIKIHHAYKGGLLEHTLEVSRICDSFSLQYKDEINRDLLISGAILHDIGKVREYMITPSGIDRTNEGELVGHISIGFEMLNKKIDKIEDFPKYLANELKHLLLSHHGEMEWGSPVLPKTNEAILLHMADNSDAKIAQFREIKKRESNGENYSWSNYDRFLNRRILMKNSEDENNE